VRLWVGPLALLLLVPLLLNVVAVVVRDHDADAGLLLRAAADPAAARALLETAFVWPTGRAVRYVTGFMLLQLALFVSLPGAVHAGPRAPSGHVPQYTANGGTAYALTVAVFEVGSAHSWLDACVVYDELLPLLTLLNVALLVGSVLLWAKEVLAPSTGDHGAPSGTPLPARIYWGEELYPSVRAAPRVRVRVRDAYWHVLVYMCVCVWVCSPVCP
jgi:hypothetical protein